MPYRPPEVSIAGPCRWIEDRKAELLHVPYFHVVFTVPEEIAAIALQNKEVVYAILFRATAETLTTIAADPKHLGAEIGFFAVLHSSGTEPPVSSAPALRRTGWWTIPQPAPLGRLPA